MACGTVYEQGDELPPVPPQSSPQIVVSAKQLQISLHRSGLLDSVLAIMASPDTDPEVRISWERSAEFHRNHPMVVAMGDALGKTVAEVDAVFALAETLI